MKTLWKQDTTLHTTFARINCCLQEDWFLLPHELALQRAHGRALEAAGLPRDLSIHGLRRSFASLTEWVEAPVGVVAQIMGHKPSATAERHYKRRPVDLLAKWHRKIETWILVQGSVSFDANAAQKGLRVVK